MKHWLLIVLAAALLPCDGCGAPPLARPEQDGLRASVTRVENAPDRLRYRLEWTRPDTRWLFIRRWSVPIVISYWSVPVGIPVGREVVNITVPADFRWGRWGGERRVFETTLDVDVPALAARASVALGASGLVAECALPE